MRTAKKILLEPQKVYNMNKNSPLVSIYYPSLTISKEPHDSTSMIRKRELKSLDEIGFLLTMKISLFVPFIALSRRRAAMVLEKKESAHCDRLVDACIIADALC